MLTITINNRTFKAPTSWAECSRSQAEALAVFVGYKTPLSTGEGQGGEVILYRPQQEALICAWLRCEPKYWATVNLQPHEYVYLLKACEWALQAPTELKFEYIEHKGKKYYLPEPSYKTATALEIAWANMDWLVYQQMITAPQAPDGGAKENPLSTGEGWGEAENALNELLSILLRPIRSDFEACQTDSRWNGDKRQPLAYHICAAIKKEIEDLPLATKRLVLVYFEAMNIAFVQEFEVLFGAGSLGDSKTVAPKYPEGFGWEASLRRIAKEGLFGSYEQVCQTNGRQIWMYEYQKYLELEAEIATAKLNEKA